MKKIAIIIGSFFVLGLVLLGIGISMNPQSLVVYDHGFKAVKPVETKLEVNDKINEVRVDVNGEYKIRFEKGITNKTTIQLAYPDTKNPSARVNNGILEIIDRTNDNKNQIGKYLGEQEIIVRLAKDTNINNFESNTTNVIMSIIGVNEINQAKIYAVNGAFGIRKTNINKLNITEEGSSNFFAKDCKLSEVESQTESGLQFYNVKAGQMKLDNEYNDIYIDNLDLYNQTGNSSIVNKEGNVEIASITPFYGKLNAVKATKSKNIFNDLKFKDHFNIERVNEEPKINITVDTGTIKITNKKK